jgi:hypothetical protein
MKHVEAFNLRLDGILRNIRWGGRLIESAQFSRIDHKLQARFTGHDSGGSHCIHYSCVNI